jgi:hypothetical protein
MDIYQLKTQFEAIHPSTPSPATVAALWRLYSETLREQVDDEDSEEYAFSAGVAEYRNGSRIIRDESLYQVYFGRLIDARKGCAWHTGEMYAFVRYPINRDFLCLIHDLGDFNVENAFRLSDGETVVRKKLDAFLASIDQQIGLWAAVRTHMPILQDIQFTIL